jgi:hypothetical protein
MFEPPADLIALQQRLDRETAAYERLCRESPSGAEILAGRATTPQEHEVWERAGRIQWAALEAKLDHPWWQTVDDRHEADKALLAAARAPA